MQIDATVSALLSEKGAEVYSVAPDCTVYKAIQVMAEKNVGALVVIQEGKLVGIFSERDYTRKVALQGKSSKRVHVEELLSKPVITAHPDSSVEECMRLMITHRIRHLPVVDGDSLLGVLSIGDLVNWTISAQDTAISQLKHFITGQYPG